ncbi:AEC family transporter [Clostridium thermopalmarium]|uniref:Membrane transport protein n=1 Tax=Clostridium thermopalmarium DSM 5974 TaxID=1121340 RepID=A0A2T0AUV3_9CLOT|nr:AEC family transporter [Clostridium thermopalmarium]PRR74300.1 Membrane transport protein [Clostridium thermopalmarium DSM 5974]PVZ22088.1 hypothetical protein LX19_01956 [Clostridium thermopalmarium DSM 5974]
MKYVFFSTILKMLPIILLVPLGFILKKLKFIKKESIEDIKKLVINIALPCLIYIGFYKLNFQRKFLVLILTISLVNILMLFIGKLIGKVFNIQNPYFPLLFSSFEVGMMGYSMFTAIYGDNELGKFAIMDLGQTFFIFFIWMPLFMSKSDKKKNIKDTLKNFFTSPIVIAIFLGIITSLISSESLYNSKIFLSLFDVINKLGSLTVPLITIIIGYELEINSSYIKLPIITIVCRMTLLIFFSLAINKYIIYSMLDLPKIYENALFTMFILPPSFTAPLFIKDDNEENRCYIVNTLSIGILLSIVVFIFSMIF